MLDFVEPLAKGQKSTALQLCTKIIYDHGPKKRMDRRNNEATPTRHIYQLEQYKGPVDPDKPDGDHYVPELSVYTFSPLARQEDIPINAFSLKKASLLMNYELDRVIDYYIEKGVEKCKEVILTPLAAAAFSIDTVMTIAKGMEWDYPGDVAKIINASCTSGGHVLPNSRAMFAAVAAVNATRNLADKTLAENIVSKTVKQYTSAGKTFNDDQIMLAMKLCGGGWPTGWSFQRIMETRAAVDKDMTVLDNNRILDLKLEKPLVPQPKTDDKSKTDGKQKSTSDASGSGSAPTGYTQ